MSSRFFIEKVTEIAGVRVILLDVRIERGHVCGGMWRGSRRLILSLVQ